MDANRRERQRAANRAEIKSAALALIAAEGGPALTMRGVARAIGMSPAGLYRYFDGLDDLLTELIADAYNDLAGYLETAGAGSGPAVDRLRAVILAYRAWAVGNPNRFLLAFGTPIPGYAAPQGGPTVIANRRMGAAFLSVIGEGLAAGELNPRSEARTVAVREDAAGGLAAGHLSTVLSTWAWFHGMVMLELGHQLDWALPDPSTFYATEVDRMLGDWIA